jgi:uncharacterized protein YgiB involved in biofilm formation
MQSQLGLTRRTRKALTCADGLDAATARAAARRPRLNAQHAMVRRFGATLVCTQAHSETAAEACCKVSAIERAAHDGASLWMKLAGAQGHKATAEKDWP